MKMLNAGQICVCPDYVLAEEDIYPELCDRILRYAKE